MEMYNDRFVAFIDILGFKNVIYSIETGSKTSVTDFEKIESVLNFLNEESIESNGHHDLLTYELRDECLIEKEIGDPIITYVSDCVVISTASTVDGLHNLFNKIAKFSTDLAADGFFLRGAITYGKLFHTGKVLFGSAYQNAYRLETEKAKNPRIILDQAVIDKFNTFDKKFPLEDIIIKKDKDELYYTRPFQLNYFPYYTFNWMQFLLRVKSHILYHLNLQDPRVEGFSSKLRELDMYYCWKEKYTYDIDFTGGCEHILKKYIWIKDEFNETINRYFMFLQNAENKMQISDITFDGTQWGPRTVLGRWR